MAEQRRIHRSVGIVESCGSFFDNYVIPLAKNLKDCGVFGVSSDEYLNYALENRREFAAKGEGIVQAMLEAERGPTPSR
jgi:hypothetical protein